MHRFAQRQFAYFGHASMLWRFSSPLISGIGNALRSRNVILSYEARRSLGFSRLSWLLRHHSENGMITERRRKYVQPRRPELLVFFDLVLLFVIVAVVGMSYRSSLG